MSAAADTSTKPAPAEAACQWQLLGPRALAGQARDGLDEEPNLSSERHVSFLRNPAEASKLNRDELGRSGSGCQRASLLEGRSA